jgi:lactoylglutathione lyase
VIAPARSLFEAHLPVADLDTSTAFYRDIVGLTLAHVTSAREAAFFWVGSPGQAMLGLWSAGSAPQKTTTHIAFGATLEDVVAAPRALRSSGVTPLNFEAQPTDEPVVLAWMPAASIYFRPTATCWSTSRCFRTDHGRMPASCPGVNGSSRGETVKTDDSHPASPSEFLSELRVSNM